LLIIGTFEHSLELELALSILEHRNIPREHIMVVPMDIEPQPDIQLRNQMPDLYAKAIEIGMACAPGSAVIGTSIGFILAWGPIFWGLFFALIGLLTGFGIYLLINGRNCRRLPKKLPEITVIVQCPQDLCGMVMDTMWQHRVLSVGQIPEVPRNTVAGG
jgi:hypothetical protein